MGFAADFIAFCLRKSWLVRRKLGNITIKDCAVTFQVFLSQTFEEFHFYGLKLSYSQCYSIEIGIPFGLYFRGTDAFLLHTRGTKNYLRCNRNAKLLILLFQLERALDFNQNRVSLLFYLFLVLVLFLR